MDNKTRSVNCLGYRFIKNTYKYLYFKKNIAKQWKFKILLPKCSWFCVFSSKSVSQKFSKHYTGSLLVCSSQSFACFLFGGLGWSLKSTTDQGRFYPCKWVQTSYSLMGIIYHTWGKQVSVTDFWNLKSENVFICRIDPKALDQVRFLPYNKI